MHTDEHSEDGGLSDSEDACGSVLASDFKCPIGPVQCACLYWIEIVFSHGGDSLSLL